MEYSCITSVMWTSEAFSQYIYSMTGGGPGYDTTTLDYMVHPKPSLRELAVWLCVGIVCAAHYRHYDLDGGADSDLRPSEQMGGMSMKKTWRQKLSVCLLVLILVSLAVIFIYPLVFLLISSLKDKISYYADPLALPQTPSIQNYLLLFRKFGILKIYQKHVPDHSQRFQHSLNTCLLGAGKLRVRKATASVEKRQRICSSSRRCSFRHR